MNIVIITVTINEFDIRRYFTQGLPTDAGSRHGEVCGGKPASLLIFLKACV